MQQHHPDRHGNSRRLRARHCAAAALGVMAWCVLGAGCASLPAVLPTGIAVTMGEPFVIAQSAPGKTGWGTYSHPNVFLYPAGGIEVGFLTAGEGSQDKILEPAYSTDGGTTWKYGLAGMLEAFQWEEKPRANFYFELPGKRYQMVDFYERRQWYYDVGGPWGKPETISIGRDLEEEIEFFPAGPKGAVSPNGNLFAAIYAHMIPNSIRPFPHPVDANEYVFVMKSQDGGKTWKKIEVANRFDSPWGNEGPNEAGVVALDDDRIVLMARTGARGSIDAVDSDSMLLAESSDGGENWDVRRMNQKGVYPQILKMSNGLLACTYGRPANYIMFSPDGGRRWGNEHPLSAIGILTTGYTGLVEIEPGRLLVVYDVMKTRLQKFWLWDPPDEANFILGRFVDVDWKGRPLSSANTRRHSDD